MIFVTVGTQLPFDRLIRAIDEAAPLLGERIVAQIGNGRYTPRHLEWHRWLTAGEQSELMAEATRIVSHAGVGSILSARRHGKPVVLFPRRKEQREHRSNHQLATADQLRGRDGVHIAKTDEDLVRLLRMELSSPTGVPSESRQELIQALRKEIHFPEVQVGGLRIGAISRARWANRMLAECQAARDGSRKNPFVVYSANGQVIAMCARSSAFKRAIQTADAIDADGQPLVIASRLLTNRPIPERSATTDLFHDAAVVAQREGLRFYFLGSSSRNLEVAVQQIRKQYPELQIAGYHHGYFSEQEEAAIVSRIAGIDVDVLWVGMGVPRQELFVSRNLEKLGRVGWVKTCGGLFDYFQPQARRAPVWMQNAGLEWLYRMSREPKRLAGRYLSTNGLALWMLLTKTQS